MSKYLSIDLEATGLEVESCYLIQMAFVPIDVAAKKVHTELAKEFYVTCPSFEDLKPNLNSWVLKHNKTLIETAHKEGVSKEDFVKITTDYLESEPIQTFFNKEKPILMGKSITALDIPLMTKYLGPEFMRTRFHHHTADVTSVARALVDGGFLPPKHASGSRLVKYYKLKDEVAHTALADAVDMATIYIKMIESLPLKDHSQNS